MKNLHALLPSVRGTYSLEYPFGQRTKFRTGGQAYVLFTPQDYADLSFFLKKRPPDLPYIFLGYGTNLLVRDGGFPGVVIHLGQIFGNVIQKTSEIFWAGAGCSCRKVSIHAWKQGLSQCEFLYGIPGSIGGALRMNAGAYGSEMKNIVLSASLMTPDGYFEICDGRKLQFSYRKCSLPSNWLFCGAYFYGVPQSQKDIRHNMLFLDQKRRRTQPGIEAFSAGCAFSNPPGFSAWKLIRDAGCQGMEYEGAFISDKHCNFLINKGSATAHSLETLGEMVRNKVWETFHIQLEWEVHRVGVQQK